MTLTEQILNKMKELMVVEGWAVSPDHVAEAVMDMINEEHPVAQNSDALYDAIVELASVLVADVGKYV